MENDKKSSLAQMPHLPRASAAAISSAEEKLTAALAQAAELQHAIDYNNDMEQQFFAVCGVPDCDKHPGRKCAAHACSWIIEQLRSSSKTEVAELQQKLATVTGERDAAIALQSKTLTMYESAVKGRQDFRSATKLARKHQAKAEATLARIEALFAPLRALQNGESNAVGVREYDRAREEQPKTNTQETNR